MDAVLAREIYIKTPGHCYGNHQSNVRFHAKMELIVGLASKIAQASGATKSQPCGKSWGGSRRWRRRSAA